MWKEIWHDKLALIGLGVFVAVVATVYIWALFVPYDALEGVFRMRFHEPMPGAPLGFDNVGRNVFHYLILGARNSFNIAFMVTGGAIAIGMLFGLFAGYFGGFFDYVLMRFLDFFSMIPNLVIIIIVAAMFNFNVITFSVMMILLTWPATARLMRSMTLRQGSLEYVSASKTLGTPNITILFREVLPNLISIITANLTITLATNIGIETGLTMLGLGLERNIPSLGRLIHFGTDAHNMQNRLWLWVPAAVLVVVMMLCINFVGQALNRAADAKKRRA